MRAGEQLWLPRPSKRGVITRSGGTLEASWRLCGMQARSFPLRSYFMVVGPTLLAVLLAISSWLEPEPRQGLGLEISSAHAADVSEMSEADEYTIFDRIRALPIR